MSSYQPRQYLFDGNSILLNKYADVEEQKYDQNFEDVVEDDPDIKQSTNYFKTKDLNNPELLNTQLSGKNNETGQNQFSPNQTGFSQTKYQNPNQTQSQFQEKNQENYQLIPQQYFENLRDEFYRQKGYMQTNPDVLFKFFLNYRVQEKKGLKINKRIQPLMIYSNDDINYSIQHYNKIFMENLQSQMNGYSTQYNSNNYPSNQFNSNYNMRQTNQTNNNFSSFVNYFGGTGQNVENAFKPKFTNETMRRLYPKQIEIEKREESKMNVSDFNNFFRKLLDNYEKKNGKLTNDENKLIDFWKNINENEMKKKGLQWEFGENNLETELTLFLSDDEIIKRLSFLFEKATGTRTTHPRPLHDYWEYKIKKRDKYYKGLFKYGKENFYKLLEARYNQEKKIRFKKEKKKKKKELEKKEKIMKIGN